MLVAVGVSSVPSGTFPSIGVLGFHVTYKRVKVFPVHLSTHRPT